MRDDAHHRLHESDELRGLYAGRGLRLVRCDRPLSLGHTDRSLVGKLLRIVGVGLVRVRRYELQLHRANVWDQQLWDGFVRDLSVGANVLGRRVFGRNDLQLHRTNVWDQQLRNGFVRDLRVGSDVLGRNLFRRRVDVHGQQPLYLDGQRPTWDAVRFVDESERDGP